jgi:hypothetical protein
LLFLFFSDFQKSETAWLYEPLSDEISFELGAFDFRLTPMILFNLKRLLQLQQEEELQNNHFNH